MKMAGKVLAVEVTLSGQITNLRCRVLAAAPLKDN
jgi:hypothetical protein